MAKSVSKRSSTGNPIQETTKTNKVNTNGVSSFMLLRLSRLNRIEISDGLSPG